MAANSAAVAMGCAISSPAGAANVVAGSRPSVSAPVSSKAVILFLMLFSPVYGRRGSYRPVSVRYAA